MRFLRDRGVCVGPDGEMHEYARGRRTGRMREGRFVRRRYRHPAGGSRYRPDGDGGQHLRGPCQARRHRRYRHRRDPGPRRSRRGPRQHHRHHGQFPGIRGFRRTYRNRRHRHYRICRDDNHDGQDRPCRPWPASRRRAHFAGRERQFDQDDNEGRPRGLRVAPERRRPRCRRFDYGLLQPDRHGGRRRPRHSRHELRPRRHYDRHGVQHDHDEGKGSQGHLRLPPGRRRYRHPLDGGYHRNRTPHGGRGQLRGRYSRLAPARNRRYRYRCRRRLDHDERRAFNGRLRSSPRKRRHSDRCGRGAAHRRRRAHPLAA